MQYHFEKREYYKVVVYDIDDFNNLENFGGHDKVGEYEFALHEVVTARDQTIHRNVECEDRARRKSDFIEITDDEKYAKNNEEMNFGMCGNFTSNDGYNFFLIHKFIGVGAYMPVYKSEIKLRVNGTCVWTENEPATASQSDVPQCAK